MKYKRILSIQEHLGRRSAFLFGPRATGKSSLISDTFQKNAQYYDLLDERVFLQLLTSPQLLEQENPDPSRLIIIDEIQKLPKLLDEVHRLIFKKQYQFLMTGSSARKLKRSASNLLGGRAREFHLFPLTYAEISDFDLERYLNRGGLPLHYLSDHPWLDLKSYLSLYLREEVAAEALTRNLSAFSRFLDVIALNNGQELHFQNLASDCAVPVNTLKNYLEILEDTLIGFQVLPFEKTKKRKAISRSKFYLFDVGIVNVLCKQKEILPGSAAFGAAFEQFIVQDIRAQLFYHQIDHPLQYWRSKSQFEVDLVIGSEVAIEIKATKNVTPKMLKGLKALQEEKLLKKYVLVCDVDRARKEEGIDILPWREFLQSFRTWF